MMRKVWKKSTWTQRIIVLLSIFILGTYYYFSTGHIPTLIKTKETVKVEEQKTDEGDTVVVIEEANPKGMEELYPLDMKEALVMDAIHGMSHQKVKAAQKWSFVPLTSERVNRLLAVVEHNKAKYDHADLYLDILERWEKGDYSQAVLDHNSIWHLQDGTVGEASRLLTSKEEEKYIEDHFSTK